MMKTALLLTSAILTLSLQLPATAGVSSFTYAADIAEQICLNTQADNKLALLKTIKEHRIQRQAVVENVVCNGQSLMDFARAEQAVKVVKMLEPTERRLRGTVTIKDVTATP